MTWDVEYLPEALDDIRALAGNQRLVVRKAIKKVSQNPLPMSEGGYGKPLRNKNGNNLTGLLKVKIRNEGIRIVYMLRRQQNRMVVVVVGARKDDEVYKVAGKRRL